MLCNSTKSKYYWFQPVQLHISHLHLICVLPATVYICQTASNITDHDLHSFIDFNIQLNLKVVVLKPFSPSTTFDVIRTSKYQNNVLFFLNWENQCLFQVFYFLKVLGTPPSGLNIDTTLKAESVKRKPSWYQVSSYFQGKKNNISPVLFCHMK